MAAVLVLYVLLAWAMSNRVPSGTTVAGVEIGGQSREAAVTRLEKASADLGGVLPVVANDRKADLDLAAAGLRLDAGQTVDELVGFSLSPVAVMKHWFGGGGETALPEPDRAKLEAALGKLAADVAVPATDARSSTSRASPS